MTVLCQAANTGIHFLHHTLAPESRHHDMTMISTFPPRAVCESRSRNTRGVESSVSLLRALCPNYGSCRRSVPSFATRVTRHDIATDWSMSESPSGGPAAAAQRARADNVPRSATAAAPRGLASDGAPSGSAGLLGKSQNGSMTVWRTLVLPGSTKTESVFNSAKRSMSKPTRPIQEDLLARQQYRPKPSSVRNVSAPRNRGRKRAVDSEVQQKIDDVSALFAGKDVVRRLARVHAAGIQRTSYDCLIFGATKRGVDIASCELHRRPS